MSDPAKIDVKVDEATVNVAAPSPAGIPMPDHPIRHRALYQAFERLWRPSAGWVTVMGLFYAFIWGPASGRPLEDGYLVQVLLFSGGILGLKTVEKVKGVS